ncbi:MAG: DUF3072 domain-containing protein [Gemmatimonadaceae bacterium]
MANNQNNQNNQNSNSNADQTHGLDNTVKNPDDWKTGDEPMTGAQRSYLHTLASDANEPVDDNMTKAEASKKIDELRGETGVANNDQQRG